MTPTAVLLALFATQGFDAPQDRFEDKRRGGRRGPPQAAFDACADKSEGDACSFTGRRRTVTGTCVSRRRGSGLVCRPKHRRRGRRRALQACQGKSEGDACSFTGRRGTVDGTCVYGRRGNRLRCRPKHRRRRRRGRR